MCSVMNFSLCILLMCITLGETILIMAPNTIRPNRDYTLVISNIFGENKSDCLLNLRLEKQKAYFVPDIDQLIFSHMVLVQPDTNEMITLNVPSNLTAGRYVIIIEGKQPSTSSIVNIHQGVYLDYKSDYLSCFIQLSKPVCTPHDILKFRVIVLDDDLKALLSSEIIVSVFVYDPFNIVVREWTNVTLIRGIFEDQIAMPVIPVLGTYKIEVKRNVRHLASKTFEVRDYEMHSNDLIVYPTVKPHVEHQALNLTIDIRNEWGISVNGTLQIDLYLVDEKLDSTWKLEMNGIRQVYLPFTKKLVIQYSRHDVRLKVTFTEQYTYRTDVGEKRITVYNYKHKVTHDSILTYRPGWPFIATLKVTDFNNKPVKNVTMRVKVGSKEEIPAQNYTSNMTGYMTIFMPTNESTKIWNLRVFEGEHLKLDTPVYELEGASHIFIEVKLLTRVKFNRKVKLMVSCSHRMTILLYYVISKGNIVGSGLFRPNRMNRYPFQIMMSTRFMPHSRILVTSLVNNKMILSTVDISIKELGNPLEIKIEENISEDGVDPGDEIELAIRGRPGAFVALTAYDQHLQQLSEAMTVYDQHLQKLFEDQDDFVADVWKILTIPHKEYFYSDHIVSVSGLYALIFDKSTKILDYHDYRARGIYPDDPRFGMPGPYRTEFLESWLWQNVTIPPSGRIGLVVKVPHSTTSWLITGFSMHPEYGLGIIKKPIQFVTKKIFYISDRLPKFIKRGKMVSLHFILFNTINEEFEANVTMYNAKDQLHFVDHPTGGSTELKIVTIPPSSETLVSFIVKPMKLGEMEIRLNASIMQGVISDSLKKIIKVLPGDFMCEGSKLLHYDSIYHKNPFAILLPIDVNIDKDILIDLTVDLIVEPKLSDFRQQLFLNVSLSYGSMEKMIYLNSSSTRNITMESILDNNRHINVTGTGGDVAAIVVKWRANTRHRFKIEMTKLASANKLLKQILVCCSFIPEIVDQHSNDTLVEVSIPIGYAMDNHSVVESTTSNPIRRFELLHDGTTLLVHYKKMGVERTCFSVFAYRRYSMPIKRPSYIRVQDSHRPESYSLKMFDFHKDRD